MVKTQPGLGRSGPVSSCAVHQAANLSSAKIIGPVEFGIRMSLGAARYDVLRLLLRWPLSMVALGVITCIVGSLAIGRVFSRFLFGIKPTDPVTFLVVPPLLAIVALMASYIPVRRATKVDPLIALRDE